MNQAEAIRQTIRLSTLQGWDRIPTAGQEELQNQMQKLFLDERIASAAVDSWLKENKWVPTPADLHQLSALFEEHQAAPIDRSCPQCGGTGFRPCWELHTYLGGLDRNNQPNKTVERITWERWRELRKTVDEVKQRVCEAVEACECGYGQFLSNARRAERLRKESEAMERRGKY